MKILEALVLGPPEHYHVKGEHVDMFDGYHSKWLI